MHYYSEKPECKEKKGKIITKIRGFNLELYTLSGIFSWRKVDNATRLLAENMVIEKGEKVLDMGCGYGIIGIVALLIGAEVVFVDVNERALRITKQNLKKMGLKGKVIKSNLYEKVCGKFDSIISNPPISAGFSVCSKIIKEAPEYLKHGGKLQIVARHKKGGEKLMELMEEVFGNVRTLAKKGGFRVYLSVFHGINN